MHSTFSSWTAVQGGHLKSCCIKYLVWGMFRPTVPTLVGIDSWVLGLERPAPVVCSSAAPVESKALR
jgi:hypothetical protein